MASPRRATASRRAVGGCVPRGGGSLAHGGRLAVGASSGERHRGTPLAGPHCRNRQPGRGGGLEAARRRLSHAYLGRRRPSRTPHDRGGTGRRRSGFHIGAADLQNDETALASIDREARWSDGNASAGSRHASAVRLLRRAVGHGTRGAGSGRVLLPLASRWAARTGRAVTRAGPRLRCRSEGMSRGPLGAFPRTRIRGWRDQRKPRRPAAGGGEALPIDHFYRASGAHPAIAALGPAGPGGPPASRP